MITYVNTVLVSNITGNNMLTSMDQLKATLVDEPSEHVGKFVIVTTDGNKAGEDPDFPMITEYNADRYSNIKIGIVTKNNAIVINPETHLPEYTPIIKWSNIINVNEIKSYVEHPYEDDTEDAVTIDFDKLDNKVLELFAEGGKRVIVRLTFKDLPTRFRKWTESYEYVTTVGETKQSLAKGVAAAVAKEWKRARVYSTVDGNKVVLTAMKYNDDNTNDSLNWANKVRFNANLYFTNPAADGWESTNKNFPKGVEITKEPGKQYVASSKLVRDRESQAMGYMGILNRGECTWPIIKPDMETDIANKYCACTLEFERTYRAADDIFRKTKECVELYCAVNGSEGDNTLTDIEKIFKRLLDLENLTGK